MPREFKRDITLDGDLDLASTWTVLEGTEHFLRALLDDWTVEDDKWKFNAHSMDPDGSCDGNSFAEVRADNEAHHQANPGHIWMRVSRHGGPLDSTEFSIRRSGSGHFELAAASRDEVRMVGVWDATRREMSRLIDAAKSGQLEPESAIAAPTIANVPTVAPPPAAKVPWHHGPYAVQIIGGIVATLLAALIIAAVVGIF